MGRKILLRTFVIFRVLGITGHFYTRIFYDITMILSKWQKMPQIDVIQYGISKFFR